MCLRVYVCAFTWNVFLYLKCFRKFSSKSKNWMDIFSFSFSIVYRQKLDRLLEHLHQLCQTKCYFNTSKSPLPVLPHYFTMCHTSHFNWKSCFSRTMCTSGYVFLYPKCFRKFCSVSKNWVDILYFSFSIVYRQKSDGLLER